MLFVTLLVLVHDVSLILYAQNAMVQFDLKGLLCILIRGGGGVIAQSVECATPVEEVPGSIPVAHSLLVRSVSV